MSNKLNLRTIGLLLTDICIIHGGILFALYLRLGLDGAIFQYFENKGWLKVPLATFICLIAIYFNDLYDYFVINNRRELFLRLIQSLGTAWAILALLFYFAPSLRLGRGTSVYSIIISLVLLLMFRSSIHFIMGHPAIGEKILIIGEGQLAIDTAHSIIERRDTGYRIAGFVSSNFNFISVHIPEARNLGQLDELENIIHLEKIERIVIAARERRGAFPFEALLRIRLAGNVNIEEGTTFYERVTGRVHLNMLRPSWLIFSGRARDTKLKTLFRDMFHRGLALFGLIVTFPVALLTAVLIKLDSKGSIFYKQERVGKNGRNFVLYKFRSMKDDAEADGTPVWAESGDDRITRVGRIIRSIRVDEIPQFWNIIKGEMNFVGPRPERLHFVSQLAEEIPYYEYRHLVAPGLTGWAQIKYPYGASVEDARQKLQYDLYYIKNQTLILDVVIFIETIKVVLLGRGGR